MQDSATDHISGILAGKIPADFDCQSLREQRLSSYENGKEAQAASYCHRSLEERAGIFSGKLNLSEELD